MTKIQILHLRGRREVVLTPPPSPVNIDVLGEVTEGYESIIINNKVVCIGKLIDNNDNEYYLQRRKG